MFKYVRIDFFLTAKRGHASFSRACCHIGHGCDMIAIDTIVDIIDPRKFLARDRTFNRADACINT